MSEINLQNKAVNLSWCCSSSSLLKLNFTKELSEGNFQGGCVAIRSWHSSEKYHLSKAKIELFSSSLNLSFQYSFNCAVTVLYEKCFMAIWACPRHSLWNTRKIECLAYVLPVFYTYGQSDGDYIVVYKSIALLLVSIFLEAWQSTRVSPYILWCWILPPSHKKVHQHRFVGIFPLTFDNNDIWNYKFILWKRITMLRHALARSELNEAKINTY